MTMKWIWRSQAAIGCALILWGCNLSDPVTEEPGCENHACAVGDVGILDGSTADVGEHSEDAISIELDGADLDGGEEDAGEIEEPCPVGGCWQVERAELTEVLTLDSGLIVATGPAGFIAHSDDGGQSWTFHSPDGEKNLSPQPVKFLEKGPDDQIFGVRERRIVRSIDLGLTFEEIPLPEGFGVYDIALIPGTTQAMAAAFEGICGHGPCEGAAARVLVSDNLETWAPVPGPQEAPLRRIWVGPNGEVLVGADGYEWFHWDAQDGDWMADGEIWRECDELRQVRWNGYGDAVALGTAGRRRDCLLFQTRDEDKFERVSATGLFLRGASYFDGIWLDDERFIVSGQGTLVVTEDSGLNWHASSTSMPEVHLGFFTGEDLYGLDRFGGRWKENEEEVWEMHAPDRGAYPLRLGFDAPEPILGSDTFGRLVQPDGVGGWEVYDDERNYWDLVQSGGRGFARVTGADHQIVTGTSWDRLSEVTLIDLPVTAVHFEPQGGICVTGSTCHIRMVNRMVDAVDTGQEAVMLVEVNIRETTSVGATRTFDHVLALRAVDGVQWHVVKAAPGKAEELIMTPSTLLMSGAYSGDGGQSWQGITQDCALGPFVYLEERDEVLALGSDDLCVSADRGLTWESRGVLSEILGEDGQVSSAIGHDQIISIFYDVGEERSLIFVSEDGAGSWNRRDIVLPTDMKVFGHLGQEMQLSGPSLTYIREIRE
ncbi:MAG: WD40/YVTN/BNR-like repeat-containing protein [Bradymonadaceae bacterium]